MKRRVETTQAMSAILTVAIALAFAAPATAGPISFGEWLQFGFGTAGSPATGCDPADPAGGFCIPSSGTPTTPLDAPPWTFVTPVQGGLLTVTDAFLAGDRFEVFDFGVSIGLTSLPTGSDDCGDDPVPCLSAAGVSSGSFVLTPGNHSLTLTPTLAPDDGGSGYLRVDASPEIPEPSAWILLAGGLAAMPVCKRRWRRSAGRGTK